MLTRNCSTLWTQLHRRQGTRGTSASFWIVFTSKTLTTYLSPHKLLYILSYPVVTTFKKTGKVFSFWFYEPLGWKRIKNLFNFNNGISLRAKNIAWWKTILYYYYIIIIILYFSIMRNYPIATFRLNCYLNINKPKNKGCARCKVWFNINRSTFFSHFEVCRVSRPNLY